MKYGSTKRHNTKPITLTFDIASEICSRIENGLPIYSRHSKTLLLDNYQISKNTYQSWLRNGIVPIDNARGRSLSQMVAGAKNRSISIRYKNTLKSFSQKEMLSFLRLPLNKKISSVRRYANGRVVFSSFEMYPDPVMVGQKRKVAEFVLERLDPSFSAQK
jgi:hypothetical protein